MHALLIARKYVLNNYVITYNVKKGDPMKHENITLSFPAELNALLRRRVSRRGISKYVADAVQEALKKEERKELLKLEKAYEESNKDQNRQEVVSDWKTLDHTDNIEGWEW